MTVRRSCRRQSIGIPSSRRVAERRAQRVEPVAFLPGGHVGGERRALQEGAAHPLRGDRLELLEAEQGEGEGGDGAGAGNGGGGQGPPPRRGQAPWGTRPR